MTSGEVYHVVRKEFTCNHRHANLTHKTSSDGKVRWQVQCAYCGESIRTIPKANLKREEMERADEWDESLREDRFRKMQERSQDLQDQIKAQEDRERSERYSAYLLSPAWRALRAKVLERDKHTCQGCLVARATQVHHRTYERIYSEMLFDLVSVCDACHKKIHPDHPSNQ
jgi:hypothetical protein